MDFMVPNEYQYAFEAKQRIYIAGRVFRVGKNLHAALKYLRSSGSRTVWVDAICINQEDEAEKMQQIRKMGRIYGQASTVLVWLGPAYLNSDLAIETVRHLSEVVHRTEFRQIFRHSVEFEDPMTVAQTLALYALLHRAYWQRAWIVQEIALAKGGIQVACGTKTISWDMMTEVLSFLRLEMDSFHRLVYKAAYGFGYYGRNLPPNFKWDNRAIQLSAVCKSLHAFGRTNLLYVLSKTRHTIAGQKHDHIFSKLELSTDGESLLPGFISYDIPVPELFVGIVNNAIQNFINLDILSYSALQDPTWQPNFPSWTPDWTAHAIHNPLIELLPNHTVTDHPFRAAEDSLPQVQIKTSCSFPRMESVVIHSLFEVEGFIVDVVDGLGSGKTLNYDANGPQGQGQSQDFSTHWIPQVRLISQELSDEARSCVMTVPLVQPW